MAPYIRNVVSVFVQYLCLVMVSSRIIARGCTLSPGWGRFWGIGIVLT